MSRASLKIDLKVLLAFSAVYIIWGTTYLAIRIGLESMPPFIMATLRYCIAGIIMLAYCWINGEKVFEKTAFANMLLGAFMMTCGQGTVFWAEKYIPSGLTAVYISTLPIWLIIADKRQWKKHFNSKLTLFSIGLGLAGVIILFKDTASKPEQHTGAITFVASLVIILSCICWAIGSLYYKYNHTAGSLFKNVGWQITGGAIACLTVSLVTGEWGLFTFNTVTAKTWLAVLYLAVAGSVIAFTASLWLLGRRPAPVVGTYAYVNPVIAVLLGYLIAGEPVTISQLAAMAIILLAAYLANRVKFSK